MRRKQVTDRLTSMAEVRASVHAHRARISRLIEERPVSPSEEAFCQAYFDHMDRELAKVEGDLVVAEDQHVRKQVQTRKVRRRSEELSSDVYDKQTSSRQILVGLYGSEHVFELAATTGRTPQGPMTLPEQVDQTVKLLRNPEGDAPTKKVGGVAIDFGVLADDLEAGLGQFRQSRVEYERRRKETDTTRLLTNQAIEEYDRVFPWVAASLEGLFRLAGEHELADRIRTSVRRLTRRQGEGPEEAEPGESETVESTSGDSGAVVPSAASSEPAEASPPPAGP